MMRSKLAIKNDPEVRSKAIFYYQKQFRVFKSDRWTPIDSDEAAQFMNQHKEPVIVCLIKGNDFEAPVELNNRNIELFYAKTDEEFKEYLSL